jgi:predicted anti-sigma-YlaC factor YlaD
MNLHHMTENVYLGEGETDMDLSCADVNDFVSDYLAGELPAEARTAFEEHLSICPECIDYIASFRMTIFVGKRAEAETPKVPEGLIESILSAVKLQR